MNILEVFAAITLRDQVSQPLENIFAKFGKFAPAAKVAVGAITAIGTATTAITKQAVAAYGEYEQLVGGIETLFGAGGKSLDEYAKSVGKSTDEATAEFEKLVGAQEEILANADTAYKRAGMSANEYMNSVITTAGAMKQAVGGDVQKAAELSDMAITDMADNVNKMGTNIASLQYAYRGFSRGTFTMLDNLALGYGGTRAEAERLLQDAEKLSGIHYDISSYADVVSAIHVIQTEMGITGTTAQEAAETITGSISAARAAYTNFVTGLADDNANIQELYNNLFDSIATVAGNIVPRIGITLSNLAQTAVTAAPQLFNAGVELLNNLIDGFVEGAPALFGEKIPAFLTWLIQAIGLGATGMVSAGVELISNLANGLQSAAISLVLAAPSIIRGIINGIKTTLPQMIQQGFELIKTLLSGMIKGVPVLIKNLPAIIQAVFTTLGQLALGAVEIGYSLVESIWNGIVGMADWLVGKVKGFFSGVYKVIKAVIKGEDVGAAISESFGDGVKKSAPGMGLAVTQGFKTAIDTAKKKIDASKAGEDIGGQMTAGVAEGIASGTGEVVDLAAEMAENIYQASSKWIDRQVKYNEMGLAEQYEAWNRVFSRLTKDNEHYSETEEKLLDLRYQINKEYQDKVTKIYDEIDKLEQNYQDTLENRTREIFNSYKLFDEIPEREKVSGEALINNLEDQIDSISSFYSNLQALSERGVSQGLIEDIRGMGVNASSELEALLNLSDEKLSEYSNLYAEKQALANEVAIKELEGLRKDTDKQIEAQMAEMQALYEQNAPYVGQKLTDGIAEGIKQGQSGVVNAAISMATAAISAVKDTLGIHSPSKVGDELGTNFGTTFAGAIGNSYLAEMEKYKGIIEDSTNFNMAQPNFASSNEGIASAGIINQLATMQQTEPRQPIQINLTLPDGSNFATWLINDLFNVARANGTPIQTA